MKMALGLSANQKQASSPLSLTGRGGVCVHLYLQPLQYHRDGCSRKWVGSHLLMLFFINVMESIKKHFFFTTSFFIYFFFLPGICFRDFCYLEAPSIREQTRQTANIWQREIIPTHKSLKEWRLDLNLSKFPKMIVPICVCWKKEHCFAT